MERRLVVTGFVVFAGCFWKPEPPGGSVTGDAAIDATVFTDANTSTNIAFVTDQRLPGTMLADPMQADAACAAAATLAQLPGTYVAWVSSEPGGVNALSRLGTSSGWVRPDGKPFADTAADITAGKLFYPLSVNEHVQLELTDQEFVFTGTDPTGIASGDDCATGNPATMGVMDATGNKWTNIGQTIACTNLFHLYCFGVGNVSPVAPAPIPTTGKLAFVSDYVPVGLSVTAFDTACQAEANAASRPGTYVALVATTMTSKRNRLPASDNGWYRVDGVKIADSEKFQSFHAPLNVTAAGAHVTGDVYSGAASLDELATVAGSCDSWSNPTSGTSHSTGDSERSSISAFTGSSNVSCGTQHRLYCFQY